MAIEVEAIDPVQLVWLPADLGILGRWELTCGACRERFRRLTWELPWGTRLSGVGCPSCGARNLLPHHPRIAGRGGRTG